MPNHAMNVGRASYSQARSLHCSKRAAMRRMDSVFQFVQQPANHLNQYNAIALHSTNYLC